MEKNSRGGFNKRMTGQKRYISYSLWGEKQMYIVGMVRNIRQAKTIYPGWQVVVYHDGSILEPVLEEIREAGAMTIKITNGIYGMFWRFYAADLPDCAYAIFRDSDSRLSDREKKAVDEWISSGNDLHVIRDHPYHQEPIDDTLYHILGGLWGIKGNLVDMTQMIANFSLNKSLNYGSDQFFLNEIYDRFKDSATIHDEFFSGRPFPAKRDGYRFVGERFDENDCPDSEDWKVIKDYYESRKLKNRVLKSIKMIIRTLIR